MRARGAPMTRHRMQNEGGGEGTSHAPSGGEEVRYALKCSISMKWIVTIEVCWLHEVYDAHWSELPSWSEGKALK